MAAFNPNDLETTKNSNNRSGNFWQSLRQGSQNPGKFIAGIFGNKGNIPSENPGVQQVLNSPPPQIQAINIREPFLNRISFPIPFVSRKNIYKDTQKLIRRYNIDPRFRSLIRRGLRHSRSTYLNRPINVYLHLISTVLPEYKKLLNRAAAIRNAEHFDQALRKIYQDKDSFKKITELVPKQKQGFNLLNRKQKEESTTAIEKKPFLEKIDQIEELGKDSKENAYQTFNEDLERDNQFDTVSPQVSPLGQTTSSLTSQLPPTILTEQDLLAGQTQQKTGPWGVTSITPATEVLPSQTLDKTIPQTKQSPALVLRAVYRTITQPAIANPVQNIIEPVKLFVKKIISHIPIPTVVAGVMGAAIGSNWGPGGIVIGGLAGGVAGNQIISPMLTGQETTTGGAPQEEESSGQSTYSSAPRSSSTGTSNLDQLRALRNLSRVGRPVSKKAVQALAKKAGQAAVQAAARAGAAAIAGTPVGWIIAAVIIIIVLFFLIFDKSLNLFPPDQNGVPVPITTSQLITVTKTGDKEVPNPVLDSNGNLVSGPDINYQLEVLFTGSGTTNVVVTDKIADNAKFSKAPAGSDTPEGKYDDKTKVVTWKLDNLAANQKKILTLTVIPTQKDTWVINNADANGSTPTGGTNQPPNQSNCNGKYKLDNPLGNFGDPSCDFTKDGLYDLLKKSDPVNADTWFYIIVPNETIPPYNPNSYADPIKVGTPDPAGAWGLYQMGRGSGGQYDHGDVPWQTQTSNAINTNNILSTKTGKVSGLPQTWCYWQSASGTLLKPDRITVCH